MSTGNDSSGRPTHLAWVPDLLVTLMILGAIAGCLYFLGVPLEEDAKPAAAAASSQDDPAKNGPEQDGDSDQ